MERKQHKHQQKQATHRLTGSTRQPTNKYVVNCRGRERERQRKRKPSLTCEHVEGLSTPIESRTRTTRSPLLLVGHCTNMCMQCGLASSSASSYPAWDPEGMPPRWFNSHAVSTTHDRCSPERYPRGCNVVLQDLQRHGYAVLAFLGLPQCLGVLGGLLLAKNTCLKKGLDENSRW